MKKALLALCLVAFLASCSKNNPWEYKVVKVAGKPAEELADYGALVYGDQTAMLNKMGKEGWEMAHLSMAIRLPCSIRWAKKAGNLSAHIPRLPQHFRTSVTLTMLLASVTIPEQAW